MNRAADANDVLRNGGVAVLRQHIDRAHVLNGALSDQNNNEQSQVYQPVVVHEAESLLAHTKPQLAWLVEGWIPANDVTLSAPTEAPAKPRSRCNSHTPAKSVGATGLVYPSNQHQRFTSAPRKASTSCIAGWLILPSVL